MASNNKPASVSSNGICPFCKNPNAYQGLNKWECPNESCRAFSAKQKEMIAVELLPEISKEERDNRAEEVEFAKEMQNYGPYIWGYQPTAPAGYSSPSTTTGKQSDDDDDARRQQMDALSQLDLLYPNH